jgi:hypothetical protein
VLCQWRNTQRLTRPAADVTTPPVRWSGVTTPPIPDSSPCFVPDSMDISPLPHKAPYNNFTTQPSPSPEIPQHEDDMLSPTDMSTSPDNASRLVSAAESVPSPQCVPWPC